MLRHKQQILVLHIETACQKITIGLAEVEREYCGHLGNDNVRYVDASLFKQVARDIAEEKDRSCVGSVALETARFRERIGKCQVLRVKGHSAAGLTGGS